MRLMSSSGFSQSLLIYKTPQIGDINFNNRTGVRLVLESEDDRDIVYVVVGEGKGSPICVVLALAVVLWLVCDVTDVTTN